MSHKPGFVEIAIAVIVGAAFGLGIYTFIYAKGLSYFSNDPQSCRNCHVMNEVFDSYLAGAHQHVATCNDCHLPQNVVGKFFIKGLNGFHHSFAFTFFSVPVSIRPTWYTKNIVQSNCTRCHAEMVSNVKSGASGREETFECIHCHREVGHEH